MGETSNQIERHIRETRNDLGENLSELEQKVKTAVDWRAQFEERPWTMIGVAFGGGILLSALLPSAHSSRRKHSENHRNISWAREPISSFTPPSDEQGRTAQPLEALKGALARAALTKFGSFIEELLPGFKLETRQDRRRRP